jgi:hypothetical protein
MGREEGNRAAEEQRIPAMTVLVITLPRPGPLLHFSGQPRALLANGSTIGAAEAPCRMCCKFQVSGYSITSSASARIEGGTVMPSVSAVLRFTISWNRGRLRDRQITRFLALEDFAHVGASSTPVAHSVRTIGYQSAVPYGHRVVVHRRLSIASSELHDLRPVNQR